MKRTRRAPAASVSRTAGFVDAPRPTLETFRLVQRRLNDPVRVDYGA